LYVVALIDSATLILFWFTEKKEKEKKGSGLFDYAQIAKKVILLIWGFV
jgi:hypothetical protein